ncbi:hypothetical protein PUN28_000925 [Cardiocondyla obscurior]|uniref:Uncharacterized protein n=1 Tax=Cardiocondyla obscurior TaxID=286306 RepID=A0AAW2H1V8_9HYME
MEFQTRYVQSNQSRDNSSLFADEGSISLGAFSLHRDPSGLHKLMLSEKMHPEVLTSPGEPPPEVNAAVVVSQRDYLRNFSHALREKEMNGREREREMGIFYTYDLIKRERTRSLLYEID